MVRGLQPNELFNRGATEHDIALGAADLEMYDR